MVPLIFLLTLFSLVDSSSVSSSASSLVGDFHALLSLKENFLSPNPVLTTWDSSNSTSVCSWTGIRCLRGRVVSLDLTDLNLSGSILSSSISKLDRLSHLSLAGNNFTGSIQITHLGNLKFLNISNNQISGNLQDWNFSAMGESLEVFDAYNNNFTAFLPSGVLSLKKLRYLDLGGNYFYGKIPKTYGNLMELEYFSLAGNDLIGKIPKELGNLTNLKEVYLGYFNSFEGGIPMEFGNMVNLLYMDLSSCDLDGSIPRELGNLKMLDTLYLHINQLSGSLPKELGNLTKLKKLDLSSNSLSGEIPFEFVNLKNLNLFNLFMNRFHGSIPNFIAELPNLETLGLWMNNFTGKIPHKLGSNGKLQLLDLSSNKLTGTIPPNLCPSNNLRILILLNNFLFGPIPQGLGSCYSLTRVRLGHNYLNGSIPNGFLYLPRLNLAELQNNFLSGTLSENDNSSSYPLTQLILSNNVLSGPLPFSLSNFSFIQILLLNGNQFSGSIPSSIGGLNQVLKLDLSRNSFSGEIPHEIENCVHLTYLDVSQSSLSGSIPSQISNLHFLNYLNLSRNHLNQTIPISIGEMRGLTVADFSFNELSGRLPESRQFAVFNVSSFAGNPLLCGAILNIPCNSTTTPPKKDTAYFKLIIALALSIFSLVLALAAILKSKSFTKNHPEGSWKMTAFDEKLEFTVSDVLKCVETGNVIGRGGSGVVYYGKMPNGEEIAVKKLFKLGHENELKAKIETVGKIRHRNIVRVLAFCSDEETNLVVYEFLRNGSLGEALRGGKDKNGAFVGWDLRYEIAVGSAKGLRYLHHDCWPLVVHRNVKSNNILLDSKFEAHVANLLEDDGGAGSYEDGGCVDEKSNVYSFGVILLELITGKEGAEVVQWCKKATNNGRKEEVMKIVDERLNGVPKDQAINMFFIAMLCLQHKTVDRPTLSDVLQMLAQFTHNPSSSSSFQNPSQTQTY